MKKLILTFLLLLIGTHAIAEERLRLATTTSTDNSGLLAVLHPPFEKSNNVKIDVISVGTGKAMRLAENGDVDLILVHAPKAELEFVEKGFGIERAPVMHNDFVILGPKDDPAGVKQSSSAAEAMKKIAESGNQFVSRGDDSGTHKKELAIWETAQVEPGGDWYLAAGQGMGAVLKIANDKLCYTLADRGTYLAYRDKIELEIVFAGDKILFNPYHVILVNPAKHPHVKTELARKYAGFIRGDEGQKIIGEFTVNNELLFVPDVISQ